MTCNAFAGISARLLSWCLVVLVTPLMAAAQSEEANNKALARRFYEEVWFSRNLAAVDEPVASDYVVHDIGDRKALRESAKEQKDVADFFWEKGTMSGHVDFQIAEGDLVATRWQWQYQPRTWLMKLSMFGGRNPIPIVNVFKDGKIVEIYR
jgi:hypothetical protein